MKDFHIGRRSMLKSGVLALAASGIPARRLLATSVVPMHAPLPQAEPSTESSHLAALRPVQVLPERVIRIVTGLRPYRPSGFVLRAEKLGGKLVIHNYGHGGCGVTLSWGTGKLAVEKARETSFRRAAVLGCGAVGLATARLLQDHGFQVTIYARDLPPDTTSNIAGALWGPVTLVDPDSRTPAFAGQLAEAARFSHRYFQNLAGDRYGVKWVAMYYLSDSPLNLSWTDSLTPELYPTVLLPQGAHSFPAASVSLRYSMLIEPNVYLPALISDFCTRGGKIVVRDFRSLKSILRLREELLVNCTGLGAKALFNDSELVPIKGQLTVLVPQPEIDYGLISLVSDLYMFPRRDGIVLGGTHERGEWSLKPDDTEAERVFKGHQQLFAAVH